MPELKEDQVQDTNEAISKRLEEQEPAGLPSAYTGQGWSDKDNKESVQHDKEVAAKLKESSKIPQNISEDAVLPKKTRNKPKPVGNGKVLTADEVLLKLEAQTAAVKWVQGIANPDIPKLSHTKVREILISMQSQIDKVKSDTLTQIQQA